MKKKQAQTSSLVERKKIVKAELKFIEEFCKGCGLCIEFCPINGLIESEKLSPKGVHLPKMKNNVECIGCDVCELICPDFAIYLKRVEVEE